MGNKILQFLNRTVLPFFLMPDSKILWKSCAFRAIGKLCRDERFDAIYTTSPPHSVHLLGRKVATVYDIKWVADFRDSWAGGVVVNEPTVLQRAVNRRLQKSVIDSADAVLSVTKGIKRQLEASGSGNTEITLLPNGYDPGDFLSTRRKTDRSRFIFCHCGSITAFSNPFFFLKAIAEFIKRYPSLAQKCLFRFVGYDSLGVFADMVKAEGVAQNVDIAGYRSHSRALEEMVNADALVLIARGRQGETFFIPGKTFEYIGSGKPILAMTDVADTADLLNGIPGAVVMNPSDIPRIVAEIAHMVQNPQEDRQPDSANMEVYTRKYQTGLFADVLDRVCAFADHSRNRI